jgi:outer membrane biogenesis lipoprotein LolB
MNFKKTLLILVAALLMACAAERPDNDDIPVEPPFQEKVSECSKIADRSERNRCLYGG